MLKKDHRVRAAGLMGRYFGTDPLVLLKRNNFEWAVTVASYDVASKAEAAANKKSTPSTPSAPRIPRRRR